MSPLRILIQYPNGQQSVIQAMASRDPNTDSKVVYVIEKTIVQNEGEDPISPRAVAYSMTTPKNSDIVGKYQLVSTEDKLQKYKIVGMEGTFYTIAECFNACVNDYCMNNSANILQIF